MNNHTQPMSLKNKMDFLLDSMTENATAGTQTTQSVKPPIDKATPAHVTRRDTFLDSLPASQQVEILRWAEQQNIKPEDPLWLLVDLMGYTKLMTETLPSRMRAAGQQTVDAIALQRRAEADAFSDNAQKTMREMLASLTAQVALASENITEIRLRKQLWRHGLLVAGGTLGLAAMCFAFGYAFADAHFQWLEQVSNNKLMSIAQVILGVPVGYLIIPILISAAVFMLNDAAARWRK